MDTNEFTTKLNADKQIREESIGIKLLNKQLQDRINLIVELEKRLTVLEKIINPEGTDPDFVKVYSDAKA